MTKLRGEALWAEVVRLEAEGVSWRQIAKNLDCAMSSVGRILKRVRANQPINGRGRGPLLGRTYYVAVHRDTGEVLKALHRTCVRADRPSLFSTPQYGRIALITRFREVADPSEWRIVPVSLSVQEAA